MTIGDKLKIILQITETKQDVLCSVIGKSRPMVNKRLNNKTPILGHELIEVLDYLAIDFGAFMVAESQTDLYHLVDHGYIQTESVPATVEHMTELLWRDCSKHISPAKRHVLKQLIYLIHALFDPDTKLPHPDHQD